jgi:HlyD family secretion protein
MNGKNSSSSSELESIVKSGHAKHLFRLRLTVGIAAGVLILAGWLWLRRGNGGPAVAPYITEPLSKGDLSVVITATGNLEPTNKITIGSEQSGTVQTVLVDINDRVTKGQVLAQLDTTKLDQQLASDRASVSSAQASIAQAEATLRESEASLKRQQELARVSGGKLPSQADMDSAVASADRAKADLLSAQASLARAEATVAIDTTNLSKAAIKSPVDGIVLTRSVEPGQTVAASLNAPELFVIAEKLERMKLTIDIAEADIGRVTSGLKATFTVDAWPDRVYSATVLRVSYGSAVTNNVVTYETELEVANDDLSLRPGMTATADIRVAERTGVLLVPAAALRYMPAVPGAAPAQQKKSFIQSVIPMPRFNRPNTKGPGGEKLEPGVGRLWLLRDGKAEPVLVKVGLTDGRSTEVSGEGLAENTPVVLRANTVTP